MILIRVSVRHADSDDIVLHFDLTAQGRLIWFAAPGQEILDSDSHQALWALEVRTNEDVINGKEKENENEYDLWI